MISAGALNKRVTILSPIAGAQDVYGKRAVTYEVTGSVWANIAPGSSSESEVNRSNVVTASTTITIRYRSDLTTRHCIGYGARTFAITGIVNTGESNTELVLTCGEVI